VLKQVVKTEADVAKICGNCVHSSGFLMLRGRLLNMLKILRATTFLQAESCVFLSVEMVTALQSVAKAQDWTSMCKLEKTPIKLFDRGCARWEANLGLMYPLKVP